jgi:SulP family sulfate permease
VTPKIITTLATYSRPAFLADIIAGITVAMVALPLCIAIAVASGADPAKGIITAIVAGFLISLLGGSRVQIGGPTGAFIVVVYGVIAQHGYHGLVVATLMAGVILVVAGLLRIGSLIAYIPESVIDGFTVGIALIIAISQVQDLLGLHGGKIPADFIGKLSALWALRDNFTPWALATGIMTIVLIVLLRCAAPRLPGLIIAVTLASAAAIRFAWPVDTIGARFGALPDRLPMPAIPHIAFTQLLDLLPSACVIAFLAGVESLLSALVADRMIGGSHRSNAELLAQGVANIGSSLFGGLPATGAIARTATNIRAGGTTPVAGLVHALVILMIMLAASRWAGYLAMPALAGILMVTAWNMSEPHKWRERLAAPASDRALLLLTMALTVFSDLTVAIGVGTALGLALRMRRRNVPPAKWMPPDR